MTLTECCGSKLLFSQLGVLKMGFLGAINHAAKLKGMNGRKRKASLGLKAEHE